MKKPTATTRLATNAMKANKVMKTPTSMKRPATKAMAANRVMKTPTVMKRPATKAMEANTVMKTPTAMKRPATKAMEVMTAMTKEDEETQLAEYFKVYLQPNPSFVGAQRVACATARMTIEKKKQAAWILTGFRDFFGQDPPSELRETPSDRELANQLIAAVLRNNSSLEDLHCGEPPIDARFSAGEVEHLLSEASTGLGALLCGSSQDLALMKYAVGTGPAPGSPRNKRQMDANLQPFRARLPTMSVVEQAFWVDERSILSARALPLTFGCARHWDKTTRSGGLWVDLPEVAGRVLLEKMPRPCIQTGHTRAVLQDQLDSTCHLYKLDVAYISGTVTAWQIMRAVFLNTVFLRGPYLGNPLLKGTSRIGDRDMKAMMIQATSNLEKILEQKATLPLSDFERWLGSL